MSYDYGYLSSAFFWIPLAACFTPYIAMSSIDDTKVTIFTIVATDLSEYGFLRLFFCTILIPPFTLIGSLSMFSELCFVLSILGNPSVVLLDEPSTGMDPEGQQQMWCIGSIQHLKSKFGKDYLLEMKVRTLTQVEPLHEEILRLFPQAARQERYSSLMVYKLPVEDVQPLSQTFSKLEIVKQSFDLEEYSLSQSTLEQLFLELSKEQELYDFEEELDPSVKWKLLPQEEP
ncbi:ATP-binding cassette sub-family A member 8 [Heterocephalus glaber]|uniref:ATP-binding cassette sub-family A member 8 n=1 Tax=Heterocephalus glaber TaxID=10181 RepID=G5B0B8_HETGA|nr:ATP-binding cassette sub-family A member 8 [Heterocephalus glaber]